MKRPQSKIEIMPARGAPSFLPPFLASKLAWVTHLSAFTLALIVSIALHAIALSIHFKLPERLARAAENTLEVVLVNAKSANRPDKPQVRAQANLDGGGNTDENRRAKTPLPPSHQTQSGDSLMEAQRRVQELEAQQQKLVALKQSKQTAKTEAAQDPQPEPPPVRGADLAASSLAIARLEAQIDKQLDDYNKRPRKKFIGARALEYSAAQYLEDWRQKVERIGNLNYPEAAKGKLYGTLRLKVEIRADGNLESVEILESSGHKILDDAALRIVRMSSPYAQFPAELKRDTDILSFIRTWMFTRSDQWHAE